MGKRGYNSVSNVNCHVIGSGNNFGIASNNVIGNNSNNVGSGNIIGSGNNFGIVTNGVVITNNVRNVRRSLKEILVTPETHGESPNIKINEEEEEEDDVVVKGLFEKVTIHRRAGYIRIEESEMNSLNIYTVAGKVEGIAKLYARSVKVHSVSGNIFLRKTYSDTADITSTSGDISIEDGEFDAATILSTTGDVEIKNSLFRHPDDVKITTTTGNIKIPESLNVKRAKATCGKVDININKRLPGAIISTTTGNITD